MFPDLKGARLLILSETHYTDSSWLKGFRIATIIVLTVGSSGPPIKPKLSAETMDVFLRHLR